MKRCVGCDEKKSLDEFYDSSNKNHKDGKNPYCKPCCKVNRALEAVRKRDARSKISIRQRNRAQSLGVTFDANITLVEIFRRDRGMCGLCHQWVQPKHASMDHTVPLSWGEAQGGTHTWSNVKLVHIKCNLRKGNRHDG